MFYCISEQYGDETSSHIVFETLLDLSDDQNYPLRGKSYLVTFDLFFFNSIVFD